jgi:hypothetical protein
MEASFPECRPNRTNAGSDRVPRGALMFAPRTAEFDGSLRCEGPFGDWSRRRRTQRAAEFGGTDRKSAALNNAWRLVRIEAETKCPAERSKNGDAEPGRWPHIRDR